MTARAFLDTNVLVYAVDVADPVKQARAMQIVASALDADAPARHVVSTQVLQEFYTTVTCKIAEPMPATEAEAAVLRLRRLGIVLLDPDLILAAIRLSRDGSLSLWDALIVRAAQEADCRLLYSEDLQHDRVFGNVRVVNPFA